MCEVVWRVRRGTTLTLLVDLSGIEWGAVLYAIGRIACAATIPSQPTSQTPKPPIEAVQHLSKSYKNSVFSVSFVVLCVKKLHSKHQNHQSKQYCLSPNLQKTPSGLSELSGSVVNKNTALQSPKTTNRSNTAPLHFPLNPHHKPYKNLCVLGVLCGSLCQKTVLQTPKPPIDITGGQHIRSGALHAQQVSGMDQAISKQHGI
jgi:hypothetical protein